MTAHLYDGDRFLGWCPTHNGVRVLPEGADSCQHEYCAGLRELEFTTPVFGIVPGGHDETYGVKRARAQEKALREYKTARENGLQPRNTEPGAVAEMEQEMESQSRALKKLEAMGNDTSKLKTHTGVR